MLKCGVKFRLKFLETCLINSLVVLGILFPVISVKGSFRMNPQDDWPMFMHDPQHTGYTDKFGPADENVLWTYDFGSPLYSSPVVKNGIVYQGSREYLCAFDADVGTLLWKTELAVVGSTPAVSENILVVATNKGISAVDTGTGDILWMYKIEELGGHPQWILEYFISSPVIMYDKVLVGSGTNFILSFSSDDETMKKFSKLLCLDIQSGELLWSKDSISSLSSSPVIQEDTVYFTSELVEAVDITSGKGKWSEASGSFLPSDPTLAKEFVVFANGEGVKAVDVNSGELVWKTELESGTSTIATDGIRLIGATITSVISLDVDTGSILWEKPLWTEINEPLDPHYSSPAIAKDRIYVGSRNRSVYCVKLEDGTVLWEYKTGGPAVASPAVVDGKMYIGSTDGKLYCFGTNPEEYFEKAEEYERKGNTERAQEFYIRAQEYYQSQGDLEMVKKCEDKLEDRSYLWVVALAGFCVIIIGALLIYRKMYKESM